MDPRTKAIEDVRDIFSRAPKGPPPRVCPSCGAEHATERAFCPSCGKRYDRRFARVNDTQRWILAGVAAVGVIAAAILILPGVFDAKRENNARTAREHAATVAADRMSELAPRMTIRGTLPSASNCGQSGGSGCAASTDASARESRGS